VNRPMPPDTGGCALFFSWFINLSLVSSVALVVLSFFESPYEDNVAVGAIGLIGFLVIYTLSRNRKW
jgi:DNA-directed RNA polymerase specialized sigma subunit